MSWCGPDGRFLLICLCSVLVPACFLVPTLCLPLRPTPAQPSNQGYLVIISPTPILNLCQIVSAHVGPASQPSYQPTHFLQTVASQQLFHWIHLLHSPQTLHHYITVSCFFFSSSSVTGHSKLQLSLLHS